MFAQIGTYLERHQDRLMANIDAAEKGAPMRMLLISLVVIALGHYTTTTMIVVTLLLCALDDVVFFLMRDRLRREKRLRDFAIVAFFYLTGSTAFAVFLTHFQFFAAGPVARFGALIVLMTSLAELGSPKTGRHVFALIVVVPIWLAFYISLTTSLLRYTPTPTDAFIGFSILGLSAVYTTGLFIANAQRNMALRRETERANAASNQKSTVLAQISHEIRTPLHAIYGTAQLLDHCTDQAQMQRLGQILLAGATDLKVLVDDVVGYAEMDGAVSVNRLSLVDPAEMVMQLGDLFQASMQAKGLKLIVSADRSTGKVMSDPVHLGQILNNLLGRSLKSACMGSIHLRQSVSADGSRLIFALQECVSTDGGARQDEAAPPTVDSLGLTISRMLAVKMGGEITVAETGQGQVEILVTLPLEQAHVAPVRAELPQIQKPSAPARMQPHAKVLAGRRVLVVDDVAINREIIGTMLKMQGAFVVEAVDGIEALRAIEENSFDLVLLDNMMPRMSGIEMLRHLRARPGPESRVTVIGISAGTLQTEREQFIATGLDGFLSKPVSMRQLCDIIIAKQNECDVDLGNVTPIRAYGTRR